MTNTVFIEITCTNYVVFITGTYLIMDENTYFTNISDIAYNVIESIYIKIALYNYPEFSFINANVLINTQFILTRKYSILLPTILLWGYALM